jgi:anaerobic C4-dicarboxylate transporter
MNKLYAFLLSKSGWLVKAPVGAAVAFATTQFQRVGIVLTEDQQIAATTSITAIVIGALESWLRHREDKNKAIVQKELGLPPSQQDSFIGPVTVEAARTSVQVEDLPPSVAQKAVAKKKPRITGIKNRP